MIVIFDTNIWVSQLGMQSNAAAAVKFFLNHNNAKFGLPEIIRLEVEKNLKDTLLAHVKSIVDSHRQLLTVFGELRQLVLPTESELSEKVNQLFEGFGVPRVDVPFSMESARSAFLKNIDRVPPCDKTQEFKDAVLWADCVKLLQQDDVILVSSDKAFYKDRNIQMGLALNLQQEIRGAAHSFKLMPDLATLLPTLETAVALDKDALSAAVLSAANNEVDRLSRQYAIGAEVLSVADYELFATGDPKELYLQFALTYDCQDMLGLTMNPKYFIKGSASYFPSEKDFRGISLQELMLDFVDEHGTPLSTGVRYLSTSATSGHAYTIHQTRYPLK